MKAKRKLSDIDFSGENAHLALTSKTLNGGPANQVDKPLVLKSSEFSEEFIQKLQQVRVTMELPDFLQKFFYLMEEEADVLAFMMGYRDQADTQEHEDMEAAEDFQDWIKSKMESLELINEMRDSESPEAVLAGAGEEAMMSLLKDQEMLEKAFTKIDLQKQELQKQKDAEKRKPRLKKSTEVAKAAEASVNTSITQREVKEGKGISPVVKQSNKDKSMADNVKVIEQLVETEVVEKSQFEAIQKQAQEQAELLKAAMQELEVFKAEKAAFIAKARKQALVDAAKDEAKADQLFKAVGSLDDADFNAVVDVVKALATAVEKSDLFVEKGASVESEVAPVLEESLVAKALKMKLQNNK